MTDSSAFPWLKHLPEDDRREFWNELLSISVQADELGTPLDQYIQRMEADIASWKATAEVHADPELYAVLTTAHEGDFGPAPRPEICPATIPNPLDLTGDLPHECEKGAGHSGQHRSKYGRQWNGKEVRNDG